MKLLLAATLVVLTVPAFAQGTTASRPAREPAGQTSLPSQAPAPSTTQATGATTQNPVVKQMNEAEKAKVEQTGK